MSGDKMVAFPECLAAPVLEIIRHYNQPLESLVNYIKNQLLNSFLPGELVDFKISQNSANIQGKIVAKENLNVKKELSDKNGIQMPSNNATVKLSSPEKAAKSVYSVKLLGKNEVITGVPGSDLRRSGSIPTKNAIRSFIVHTGAKYEGFDTGRWITDENDAIKLSIMTSKKCASGSKRKLKNLNDCTSKSELETCKTTGTSEPKKKRRKAKKAEQKAELTLSPVWAKMLQNASLEPEVVLERLSGGCQDISKSAIEKGSVKLKSPVLSNEKADGTITSPTSTKKMKQMTLFEMTKRLPSPPSASCSTVSKASQNVSNSESAIDGGGVMSPSISNEKIVTVEDKARTLPESVGSSHLKNGFTKKMKANALVLKKSKTEQTIVNKANRIFVIRNKKSDSNVKGSKTASEIKSKTEREKMLLVIDYSKDKKGSPHANSVKAKQALLLPKVNYIPPPKLVKTPAGFENQWLGDALMIIEFAYSYRNILRLDKSIVLSVDSLMEAVISGKKGFLYFGNLLICFLRTLVKGTDSDEYKVLSVSLKDIPINLYTVSEVARLCLLSEGEEDSFALSSITLSLSKTEIYLLEPHTILSLMCLLCMKLLDCPRVKQYVEVQRNEAIKLQADKKKFITEKKKALDLKNKEMEKIATEQKENVSVSPIPDKNFNTSDQEVKKLSSSDFYGVISTSGTLQENLNSTILSRKVLSEKVQTERQIAITLARERELKEAEELKKQKDEEELFSKAQASKEMNSMLRHSLPLGVDRYYSRYWLFSHPTRFVVERGWMRNFEDTHQIGGTNCENKKESSERGGNQWFTYETEQEVQKLVDALSCDGEEKLLKIRLNKSLNIIVESVKSTSAIKYGQTAEESNNEFDLIVRLREALVDLEERVTAGTLGEVKTCDAWLVDVAAAATCEDFAKCFKLLQESINPRFVCGLFAESHKQSSTSEDGVNSWKRLVDSCSTISGMHVLLCVLETCINWKRSSLHQRCKVCRRRVKGDDCDHRLLLCDECNAGYHLKCLRPPLDNIPFEEWFCPLCQRVYDSRKSEEEEEEEEEEDDDDDDYSSNSEEKETSEEDDCDDSNEYCSRCANDEKSCVCSRRDSERLDMLESLAKMPCEECKRRGEKLALCSKCYQCFHKACHVPPLRNYPRGHWICYKCKANAGRSNGKYRRSASLGKEHKQSDRRDPRCLSNVTRVLRSRRDDSRDRQTRRDNLRSRRSSKSSLFHNFDFRRRCSVRLRRQDIHT